MHALSHLVAAPAATTPAAVAADMSYLAADTVGRPWSYTHTPPPGTPWESGRYESHAVAITDARGLLRPPSLAIEGFELRHAPTAVRDFDDEAAVRHTYYPEAAALALQLTGGCEAHVFDHLVRRRDDRATPLSFGRGASAGRAAANGRIHNDYTEASGLLRLERVLGDGALARRVRRFSIVNVWRALTGPEQDTPLAVCDARTVGAADLVEAEVRYPRRTGHIYLLRHSPRHRWYYYPRMARDEALVFKQYDSQLSGPARFTPHAAFDLPHPPPGTPPRESIELRCLVIHDTDD